MTARSKIFLIGLPVLVATTIVATIIAIFVYVSFATHDPHWLYRGGALIAAVSAGAIFFQIRYEIDIERRRRDLERASPEEPKAIVSSRLKDKATQLEKNRIELLVSGLSRELLQIAAIVVLCALVGELIHGFGDLVLEMSFPLYFPH